MCNFCCTFAAEMKNHLLMKRIFYLFFVLSVALSAQAQVGVGYYRSGYGSVQKTQDVGPLTREGNIYYYHGKPMKRAEMVQLLNDNCKEAYDYYRKQQKIEKAGWGIFGAGAGLVLIGGGVLGGSESYYKNNISPMYPVNKQNEWLYDKRYHTYKTMQRAGVGIMISSAVAVACVSIPMIIAGNVQKKNAHKVFNTWCGYKELEEQETSRLELRLNAGANGLGVALAF